MADIRSRIAVKVVDPTTDANEVGVSAAGNLNVAVNLALPAGTNNIGDVDIASFAAADTDADDDIVAAAQTSLRVIGLMYGFDGTQWERIQTDAAGAMDVNVSSGTVDTELPAAAAMSDAFANPTAPAVGAALLGFDGTDWGRVRIDATTFRLQTDIVGALPAGTNNIGDVDVLSMPTGASATEVQGTAADGTAPVGDPVLMAGFDGTNVQSLATDASGNLQVDVLTGGGADAPTAPKVDTVTSAALAAGSSVSLDGTQVASGLTGKLAGVTVSASVPIKVEVRTALNAAYTTRVVLFGRANEPIAWVAPHRDYISQAESVTAGFDGFNLNITNLDNSQAADVYGTMLWDEQ